MKSDKAWKNYLIKLYILTEIERLLVPDKKYILGLFISIFFNFANGQVPGSGNNLLFNGNQYIDVGNVTANTSFPVSVCAWIKPQSSSIPMAIYSSNSLTSIEYCGFWLQINNSFLHLAFGDGSGTSPGDRRSKNATINGTVGNWIHVAGVIRGPTDMDIYLNGVDIGGSYTGTGGPWVNGSGPGHIGRTATGTGWWNFFKGNIDELSVWSKSLTQTEIRNLMCKSLTGNEPQLLTYYKVDQTSGSVLVNSKPGASNGSLQGNPGWNLSEAALGNTSSYNYAPGGLTSYTKTLSNGQQIIVENINPPVPGVQVYEVSQPPNSTTGLPAGSSVSDYFGVFLCRTDLNTNYTYNLRIVNPAQGVEIYGRDHNAQQQWQLKSISTSGNDSLITAEQNRQEYIIKTVAPVPPSTCLIEENYNSSDGWTTQGGNQIRISNGKLRFVNAVDGSNKRMYKRLPKTVPDDCFKLRCDFTAASGGVNEVSGHILLALTDSNDCVHNTCSSVHTNFIISSENGLHLNISTPRFNLPVSLWVRSQLNGNELRSNTIEIQYGNKYYVELERVNAIQGRLSVYSNSGYSQHIAGSPILFPIQANLKGLDYLQHSVHSQGHPDRVLNASLDNVCINKGDCYCDAKVNLGEDIKVCSSEVVYLKPQPIKPNVKYTWSDGSVADSINVSSSGLYWVEIDSAGCFGYDTIAVEIAKPVEPDLGDDRLLCEGENLVLQPLNYYAGTQYSWSNGFNGNQITVSDTGVYWIRADSSGCIGFDTIKIYSIFSIPNLPTDTVLCYERNTLSIHTPFHFEWPDGSSGNEPYTIYAPGEVTINIFTRCDTLEHKIQVSLTRCDCKLEVPDAFTPNGDGVNDLFLLQSGCNLDNYRIIISNRWGMKIFESHSIEHSWDGTYKGSPAQVGVYYFAIEYQSITRKFIEGTLTLYR